MDGPGDARVAHARAHRLAIHGRARRVHALGPDDGARSFRRHRGRPGAARTHPHRHASDRRGHRARSRGHLREWRGWLRAARCARGRLWIAVGARLSRATDGPLRDSRSATGRAGRVARDRVDADRQDARPTGCGCVSGARGSERQLRADGGGVRDRAWRVAWAARAARRRAAGAVGVRRGKPARGSARCVDTSHHPHRAARDDRDQHAVLHLPTRAAGVRPRRA